MDNNVDLLHQKIDALTAQVAFLTEQAQIQQRRQTEMDELKQDMIPIANHMVRLSIDELADLGEEFEINDLFFVLKRMMRNTSLILDMFDRVEALMGITDEVELLGKQVFANAVEKLEEMERIGYFTFIREGQAVMERIVTEFSEEDLRDLSDNVVPLLTTMRNLTQPEVLTLANNAIGAIKEAPEENEKISLLALLRELSDPKARLGMARMIDLLKALGER